MAKFQRHLFTCVNLREGADPRGSCAKACGGEVATALKKGVHERGLKRVVRANKAYCLDQCEHGPVVVVYPEAVWYGRVTAEDVEEILERHVVGGEVVERLVIPDDQLTGRGVPAPEGES